MIYTDRQTSAARSLAYAGYDLFECKHSYDDRCEHAHVAEDAARAFIAAIDPEPTSSTEVVVGKPRQANCTRCDRIEAHSIGNEALLARRREQLAKAREEVDQLKARIAELEADKPKPGPWRADKELRDLMPTLRAGDVVEAGYKGHTVTGKLWEGDGTLWMCGFAVRYARGSVGLNVDALRIIERAPEPEPEPSAGIPDEVVKAAWRAYTSGFEFGMDAIRVALAAADAKRAELMGGEQ